MKKPTLVLDAAQIKTLDSLTPIIHSLKSQLEPVVSKQIQKQLNLVYNSINNILKEYRDKEDDEFRMNEKFLRKFAKKHQLKTIWSIDDVLVQDMTKLFSSNTVKSITYKSWGPKQSVVVEKLPNELTWLDMWKFADDLILLSGDTHHVFIEAFIESNKKGHYELLVGS